MKEHKHRNSCQTNTWKFEDVHWVTCAHWLMAPESNWWKGRDWKERGLSGMNKIALRYLPCSWPYWWCYWPEHASSGDLHFEHKRVHGYPWHPLVPLDRLFGTLRPDIAIVHEGTIFVLELTVCHESNIEKSRRYKQDKYKLLRTNLLESHQLLSIKLFTVEVTTFGFMSNMNDFCKSVSIKLSNSIKDSITKAVVISTRSIYLARNSLS